MANNSEKIISYCSYKLSYILEPYLGKIKVPKYRNALARLRTSSHDLKIEKGIHQNIQYERKLRIKFCENRNQIPIENDIISFKCAKNT